MAGKATRAVPDDAPRRVVVWNACAWRPAWLVRQLATLAARNSPADDPFRPQGESHSLLKTAAGADRARRDEAVTAALAGRDLIAVNQGEKELDPFYHALVTIASRAGFQHLLLYQRDGLDRLCALAGAQPPADEAQVRALMRRERLLTLNGARLRRSLQGPLHKRRLVALEDLASDDEAATRRWLELLAFMGAEGEPAAAPIALCRTRLAAELRSLRGQPRSQQAVMAREAEFLPGLETPPAFLQPEVHVAPDPAGLLRLVQLNVASRPLVEDDAVTVGGMVLAAGPHASQSLACLQGAQVQAVTWRQPSPALKARMPEAAGADRARVKPFTVRARAGEAAQVQMRDGSNDSRTPVAEIRFAPAGRVPIEGVLLARWSIGYQPVPKVACTSLKEALFEVATGKPFPRDAHAADRHIHDFFYRRPVDVSGAAFKFLVVRDPIRRLLSAYGNRVVHFKELSREYLSRLPEAPSLDLDRFPFDPTLDEFVERFEFYCRVPTILHHCRPMSQFVAPLASFDKVYAFEELDVLCRDLARIIGKPFVLPHSQRGGPKLVPAMLSERSIARLLEIYAADYALLDGLCARPAVATLKADAG